MHLLYSRKNDFTNQKILLLNLSLVETLSCTAMLVYWLDGYFKFCYVVNIGTSDSMSAECIFLFAIDWYFYLLCLLSPMTLLLDRFLGVTFPLKYCHIFPNRRAKIAVIVQWITMIILTTPLSLLSHKLWLKYLQCLAITTELLVLSSAVTTYSWIAYKVRKYGDLFNRSNADSRVLKIASLIVFTYLCFVVLPELTLFVMMQLDSNKANIYQKIFYSITCVNYVSDPLIYILGYPALRRAIRRSTKKMKNVLSFPNAQEIT